MVEKMRLVCPSCGASCSAEAWGNDAKARDVLAVIAGLERPALVVRYLGLFRPANRGLAWDRAGALVEELRSLLGLSELSWRAGRPLLVRPGLWYSAMEILIEKEGVGKLTRPIQNHNLLKAVAYDLAGKQEAGQEREKEEKLRYRADAGRTVGTGAHRPEALVVKGPQPESPDIESVGAGVRGLLQKLRENRANENR
ncbi:hypothetical protein SAMN05660653_00165 [Desulfonatronum thiosulfatophilum]|uniref:Uncharacterized protein n=1 Tax=Desulfonatronum thiosulfatophilum TaxID=617002 RepID=A0A1G6A5E2_9BACT|nr:hypothetical protein [Desulfonatronum thiosulfatophilum]SDB03642.1 hypothetical protein SAMN05660653_00165 [Desulfonatronum thiosulfatophilum]